MVRTVTKRKFTYDLDDEVDYKKYLTTNLLETQFDKEIVEDILGGFVNVSDDDYVLDNMDEEVNEYIADDFAGDVKNEYTDKIESGFKELSVDDIHNIHAIVDPERPNRNIPLSVKYITEDELSNTKYKVQSYNPTSKKMVEKEYTKQREDIPKYVYADDSNTKRLMVFDWDKILGIQGMNDELKEKNLGHVCTTLIEQKSYLGILDKIINDYNYMINEYPEFGYRVFAFRSRSINEKEKYDINNFIYDIAELINDNTFRSIVAAIDDTTYEISLDKDSKTGDRKIVEDLRVTDECNKTLLKTSVISRLLIPIINDYVKDYTRYTEMSNDASKYVFNYLTGVIFSYVARFLSVEFDVNLLNKLHKIVEPRIRATLYSNRVIWRFLECHTMDEETAVQKITNKIIRTIIPKIDLNRSSVSFLEVVIRNMITSEFRYNFAYNHKIINVSTGADDDDSSELDKVALTHYHKVNEMDDAIVIASVHQWLKRQVKIHNITDEEVEAGIKHIRTLNEFQIVLLNMYYTAIFPTIDKCNTTQLVKLILILHRVLQKHGMNYLADLLLAKRTDDKYVKSSSGRVTSDIMKSKTYQEVRSSYKYIMDKFDRDAFLLRLVSVVNFEFAKMDLETGEWIRLESMDKVRLSEEIFSYAALCMNL